MRWRGNSPNLVPRSASGPVGSRNAPVWGGFNVRNGMLALIACFPSCVLPTRFGVEKSATIYAVPTGLPLEYDRIMQLTPTGFQLKNSIIPWSFEPAGLQPRKINR